MIINLKEIPAEGQQYICNSKTAEFNEALFDLIGATLYQTEFFIKPSSQGYEITGFIRTQMNELCSRCGIDIKLPIYTKFHEFLIQKQSDPRRSHYAKANHYSDLHSEDRPSVVEFDNAEFDMGEYLHEIVAIETPYVPAPPENEKGDCSVCGLYVRDKAFNYEEPLPVEEKQSPFSVLKGIKLN